MNYILHPYICIQWKFPIHEIVFLKIKKTQWQQKSSNKNKTSAKMYLYSYSYFRFCFHSCKRKYSYFIYIFCYCSNTYFFPFTGVVLKDYVLQNAFFACTTAAAFNIASCPCCCYSFCFACASCLAQFLLCPESWQYTALMLKANVEQQKEKGKQHI